VKLPEAAGRGRGTPCAPVGARDSAWDGLAGASSGVAAVAAGSGAGRAAHRRPKTRARVLRPGRPVATESRGRAGALAWPAAVSSGLAAACASSSGSSNLARRQWQPWPWRPRQQSRGGRRRARGRRSGEARASALEGRGATERQTTRRQRSAMVGRERAHGRHEQATRRPLRRFREHLAGDGVAGVEREFGLATGRFGSWAQNKVCSPRHALRILFKVPGHLSFVIADN